MARLLKHLFLILFLLFYHHVTAGSISGKVIDKTKDEPLQGVNIEILNTTVGTTSDDLGFFKIEKLTNGACTLQASFIGYKTVRKSVNISDLKSVFITIVLEPVTLEGESIIVEARPFPNRAVERESPVAYTRLQKAELSAVYTTGDFSQLLKKIPGIWTSSAGVGESEISLRGFSSQGIHFMINDIPMNNPEDQHITISNWAGLANMARSVEVLRGGGFSLYSPNAFGGTINISTMGLDEKQSTIFRISGGMYNRTGIANGADKGKIFDQDNGLADAKKNLPVNYSYSARFNSGLLYNGAFNASLFFERKYGDSYILGTNYNGFTIGLDAEYRMHPHYFYFGFFVNPQSHEQAFALQDMNLLESLGREYNRKNHEWQENYFVKPYWFLKHIFHLSGNRTWTNSLFYTIGRGADQTCANDFFDTKTGVTGFQPITRGKDFIAFGMHAEYLYYNYGLLSTDFSPFGEGREAYSFKGVPFSTDPEGVNFFADQHTHSYQSRLRRDHQQFGLASSFSQPVNHNWHLDFGMDSRFWKGHRKSEMHLLKVSDLDTRYSLNSPFLDDIFIPKVQSIYDYNTRAFNLSLFSKLSWKATNSLTIQAGIPFYYSQLEVIENPIRLIDFGSWQFFETALRTSADIVAEGKKFALTNDYQREYTYFTPWTGANYNVDEHLNIFSRIASSKKEPSIFDWYDYANGPVPEKEFHPENEEAVTLKPETVNSIELGGTYREQNWTMSLNYYYSVYLDKIERVIDINERYTTLNAGKAVFQGLESSAAWQEGQFELSGSLAFSSNRWKKMNVEQIFDADAADVKGKVVPFAPQQQATVDIGYYLFTDKSFKIGFSLDYWNDYYGTYTNNYISTEENFVGDNRYIEHILKSSKLPYFLDLGARLQYRTSTEKFDFLFRIDADNILNRTDNFMRAQYTIDYTRDDFYAGKYNWYVLQAPLFNVFFTAEITLNEQ